MLKRFKKEFTSKLEVMPSKFRMDFVVYLSAFDFEVFKVIMADMEIEQASEFLGAKKHKIIDSAKNILNKIDSEVLSCH